MHTCKNKNPIFSINILTLVSCYRLHGSYEALKGGTTSEALEDMTGGLTEFYDLQERTENLMQLMVRGFEMGSLFGCSIEADPHVWEAKLQNGLVKVNI